VRQRHGAVARDRRVAAVDVAEHERLVAAAREQPAAVAREAARRHARRVVVERLQRPVAARRVEDVNEPVAPSAFASGARAR